MGVSFRVSNTGKRYRPKPGFQPEASTDEVLGDSSEGKGDPSCKKLEGNSMEGGDDIAGISGSFLSEHESSFALNLYADGYSIGKPSEEAIALTAVQVAPNLLHPYDRTSETLFSAIESGHLPGDILDDIPCKFINGMLICEVRDYRKCALEHGAGTSPVVNRVCLKMSLENVVKDIPLISDNSWTYGDMMEFEARIVKALQPQLFLDPTPRLDRLCSNPVPTKLNLGLSNMRRKRLSELRKPEVTITTNNRTHGKKVCIERVVDTSNSRSGDTGFMSGNLIGQHVQENLASQNLGSSNVFALGSRSFTPDGNISALPVGLQHAGYSVGVGTPRTMQEQVSGSMVNVPGASYTAQDMFNDSVNSGPSHHGKRETCDGRMPPLSALNKKARLTSQPSDGMQQQLQQMGQPVDGLHGSEINWRNPIFQQAAMARGMTYSNAGMPKYHMAEGLLNPNSGQSSFPAGQSGMRFGLKEEHFEQEKLNTELNQMVHFDPQQRMQQNVMRPNISQAAWNNHNQELRKEEQMRKRKSEQSPRLSSGALAQSPLSSKSGELSSGSGGPHFGAVVAASALGSSQKEKSDVNSGPTGGALPSSASDLQWQPPSQPSSKRRSNSLPKNPVMNAVGSPASVSNVSIPFNASSPSVGTPTMADQAMIERFSKIDMVTMRHQLIPRKHKVEDIPARKPNAYSSQKLLTCLSNSANGEDFNDDSSTTNLSKSLVGGSMNVYKTRVINFLQADQVLQGNVVSMVTRLKTRMILSEKPSDGTVALHYGEVEDGDILSAEDYLPSLPNAHFADLLAAQFCSLMIRDGYIVEDHIQPKPVHAGLPNQLNASGVPPGSSAAELQQFGEAGASQQSNEARPTLGGNASIGSPQNQLVSTRMLPPISSQPLQMPQGSLPGVSMLTRPQQLEPPPTIQQQPLQQQLPPQSPHAFSQQQHPQFQRPSMVLPSNPLPHLNALGQNANMQLGGHMVNKASSLQMQLLQQQQQQPLLSQQQQQQQPQMQQRKMMMGLGPAMGMGNLPNNIVGLGGLGNAMGIGGMRGIGGPGISGPMTPTGLNSMGQNQLNLNAISQQIRSGQLTPQQAAIITSKLRIAAQNRTNMLAGNQSGIAGMQAGRQIHPGSAGLSMLGQSLNRANMNPMQRSAMGPMGPPKLMSGMNMYTNQQQQQLQLQQQQQLQLQQQQQQQLQQQQQMQQQEATSSLQAVVSPSQVGSPSASVMTQLNQPSQQQQQSLQQPSPQQMSQRTPMSPQLSSGAIRAMSTGNPDACPASPQLSSQTHGSVGSITNSTMDLQGVNKANNSVSNA